MEARASVTSRSSPSAASSLERAPGVFAAGADIVAVVTDITLNADPEARLTRLGRGDADGRRAA